MLKRLAPPLLLALLPALFLWKLTLGGRILVGLDPFNFFYPYHDALAAALAQGRLPQWNPSLFGGVPFLADSQAQAFYPLGWLFLGLSAPAALTWSVVLHLGLAGVGAYAWARRGLGLGRWGAWVAGALFALTGYLGAQVEHVNQVQAAAWLPWLLLGYEQGRAGRRAGVALGALSLALSLLAGHAQTTFISLVLLGLWVLRSLLRDYGVLRAELLAAHRSGLYMGAAGVAWRQYLIRNLLPLLLTLLVGGLLAMIQLVPTQQLAALSTRAGGLGLREAASFSLDPRVLPRALLPTFGQDARLLSEYVAWVGFVGLALALVGALGRGASRASEKARDFGLISAGTGLFLAFGGYNPIFWLLWRVVPGFDLFRAPARWLLLWALGVAVLAGAGVENGERGTGNAERRPTTDDRQPTTRNRRLPWQGALRERRVWAGILVAGALMLLLLIVGAWPPLKVLPWWIGAAGAAGLLLAAARVWPRGWRVPYPALVVGVMLLEVALAARGLEYQVATAPEAYTGLRPVPAHLLTVQPEVGAARLLSLSDLTWDPGDLGALQQRHEGLLGEEAIYNLVVVTKLKEVLAPNQPMRWGLRTADGYGGGLLPTARWVTFQRTLPLAELVPDGRLREQLTGLPRAALLDVMGVEWLVADKVFDWWSENVFHDLGAPLALEDGATVTWDSNGFSQVTALSFVVIGEWPEGAGSVTLGPRTLSLDGAEVRATRETARGLEQHLWLPVDPPAPLDTVTLRAAAPWTLGALSWVDERVSGFEPLPADPALRTTLSGDVKVYQRAAAPGRAWLLPQALPARDPDAAAALLSDPTFDPRAQVIVETDSATTMPEGGAGTVQWLRDEPEQLALRVSAPEGGWLVLADAPFPGWQATVDGAPAAWHPANVINRALWLPPGEHLVEWRYQTPGLAMGAALSALGAILLAGWLCLRTTGTIHASLTEDIGYWVLAIAARKSPIFNL